MKWNSVQHFQLWNSYSADRLIHFPWATNSCALDSILSALWVIYERFHYNADQLRLFAEEFSTVLSIFHDLHYGRIHNIQAKELLVKVFLIDDGRYKNGDFVETNLITDFMKSKLHVIHTDTSQSTFQWKFIVYWKCMTCVNVHKDDNIHMRDNITFMARSSKFTVQASLDSFLSDSVRRKLCDKCKNEKCKGNCSTS